MKATASSFSKLLLVLLAGCFSACDKSKEGGQTSAAPEAASSPAAETANPAAPANPLLVNAERMGMAAKLGKEISLYFGSANLKTHREALEKTEYWKRIQAFLQDKKPTQGAAKATPDLEDMQVDDLFFAMGESAPSSMKWLIDLNRAYNEYTYRTLVTGFAGGGAKTNAFDLSAMLSNAATSPQLIERICALLEQAELPPLLAGIRTAKAPELATVALAALKELKLPPGIEQGELPVGTNETLTTFKGTFGAWLTPELRQEWTNNLAKSIADPGLVEKIRKALDALATKPFGVAFGVSKDWLLVAVGNDFSHLRFAQSPVESLLARPEMASTYPHAGKSVLGLFFATAELQKSMNDDQPVTPLLTGALSGLAATPMFSALTQELEPKVAALAEAERGFYNFTFDAASGIMWWDKGFHMEAAGGISPKDSILDRPLKFAALLNTPDAIFTGVGNSPRNPAARLYFERWMELLYAVTSGLIRTGLGGDQALGVFALADKGVVPPLLDIYRASKSLYNEGLGTESAMVIDLKGVPPTPPGATESETPAGQPTPKPPTATIPRIAGVHEIVDQTVMKQAWLEIETNLAKALKAFPTPIPTAALTPISSEKDGLTTWFFPLPLGGNDVLPCVSLNDKLYILGTSKNLNESIAATLTRPAPPLTGLHNRLSIAALRNYLKTLAGSAMPGVPSATTEQVSAVLPWLAPFGDLRVRVWNDGGRARQSFEIEATDVRRVD